MKNNYYKDLFSKLFKKSSFIISLTILTLLFIVSFFYYHFSSEDVFSFNFDNAFISPNRDYLFGTNSYGQNQFNLIFIAIYNTLKLAFIVTLIRIILGCIVGILWGTYTKLDTFFILIRNVLNNIPMVFVYVIIISSLGNSFTTLVLTISLFGWMSHASLIRNNLILLRNRDYNKMSKLLKTPFIKVAINNYLPSVLPIIFNSIAISFPSIIALEVTLSYFGFSLGSHSISLGGIIYDAIANNNCFANPYLLIIPFLFLLIINLCFFSISKNISSVSNKEVDNND